MAADSALANKSLARRLVVRLALTIIVVSVLAVAVTASAFREQEQEMLDAGMNDFVSKPYRFDEIYDCLARQLGVEYVYRTDAPKGPPPAPAPTPARVAALPASLQGELGDALRLLDSERISGLIEQVASIDAELASALSLLDKQFDYSAMLRLFEDAARAPVVSKEAE